MNYDDKGLFFIDAQDTDPIPYVAGLADIIPAEKKEPKSQSVSEITVVIRDDEKSLRAKYLIYDEYSVSSDDEIIKKCIAETLKSFDGEPSDVKIRINFSL